MSMVAGIAVFVAVLLPLSHWGSYVLLAVFKAHELQLQLDQNTPSRARHQRAWVVLLLWLGTAIVAGMVLAFLPGALSATDVRASQSFEATQLHASLDGPL